MSIWWAIPAFLALVGVLSVFSGLGRMVRLRLLTGSMRFLFGGFVLAGAAVVGLIGLNLQTYARLTHERLAAEVTLTETGPGAYTASVAKANEEGVLGAPTSYALTGDSFRIEADVVKFKPWANVLGIDSLYRFDRIQGRWDDTEVENANPPKAFSLRDAAGIDLFSLPLGDANPLQKPDAEFVNGLAQPMADGAVYTIHMSQSALIPRPKNEAAEAAIKARRKREGNGAIDLMQQPAPE
jgi:hypothetical protein